MSASLLKRAFLALILVGGFAAGLATNVSAQSAKPQGFPTPEAAADALTDAIRRAETAIIANIIRFATR